MEIIQGLINGIRKKAGEVARAAGDIANGIAKKIGGILKLGSPSKVMIEMGENTGDGMAIGMEHSMKRINNMAANMAKNAIPDLKNGNANDNGNTTKTNECKYQQPKSFERKGSKFGLE